MAAVSWDALSWAYAFLGNSLMEPMTQGNHAGLDPSFWDTFPDFGSEELAEKLDECADCAQNLIVSYGDDAVNRTSVDTPACSWARRRPRPFPGKDTIRTARAAWKARNPLQIWPAC